MDALWQQLIVFGALGLAIAYIVFHLARRRKVEPGCKSCPAMKALSEKADDSKKTASV